MIEVILGMEELDIHNVSMRFRSNDNPRSRGPLLAIGRNLKILGRGRRTEDSGNEGDFDSEVDQDTTSPL